MLDQRLQALRDKEPVIIAYRSDALLASAEVGDNAYRIHAATHISMGDTSTFKEVLLQWATCSNHCVLGAIVGPYGYGKTSTEVHLWHERLMADSFSGVATYAVTSHSRHAASLCASHRLNGSPYIGHSLPRLQTTQPAGQITSYMRFLA